MSELEEAISQEREEAAPASAPEDKEEARKERIRARDRERKRKEREAKGAAPRKPRSESKESKEKPPKELDPRVAKAVEMCMASMMADTITPEFAAEMEQAMRAALAYEIEVRLPLLADGFEPEIGLSCAIIGSGVTRFRLKRQETVKAKHTVVRDVPPDPPPAPADAAPDGSAAPAGETGGALQ